MKCVRAKNQRGGAFKVPPPPDRIGLNGKHFYLSFEVMVTYFWQTVITVSRLHNLTCTHLDICLHDTIVCNDKIRSCVEAEGIYYFLMN